MATLKYKVVNATSLTYRNKPSKSGKAIGYLKEGESVTVERGWHKNADGIKWFKMKKDNKTYYVSSNYLQRVTPNYRKNVVDKAKTVYNTILELGCKHESGAKSFDQIKKQKRTTCASAVSAALQLAGVLKPNTLVSHTSAVGSSKGVKKKNTIGKAIYGHKNLISGTYDIRKIGKKFSSMSSAYKVAGAVYVYDSNIAIYKGNGVFYTCNNGASQKKNGKYIKNTAKSGYCVTSPILYAIIPRN